MFRKFLHSISFSRKKRISKHAVDVMKVKLPPEIDTIRYRAFQGHVEDQVLWGMVLLDSVHVAPDIEDARRWFMIAANAGYASGYTMMGRSYQIGYGALPDFSSAASYYEKAVLLGDDWGRYNLGILKMRGLGVQKDMKAALSLFSEAAKNGHPKSMNLLARFMEEGWETPRDPEGALVWYKASAEGGDYRGCHNYATALAAVGNMEEAQKWWERAIPDATPDILQAMEKSFERLEKKVNAKLYDSLRVRLKDLRERQVI